VSFADWVNNGWLVAHKSSKQEIANLLGIVARDLKDSQAKDVSDDWCFAIAYNKFIPRRSHRTPGSDRDGSFVRRSARFRSNDIWPIDHHVMPASARDDSVSALAVDLPSPCKRWSVRPTV